MPPKRLPSAPIDPLVQSSKSPITQIEDIKCFVKNKIQLLPEKDQKELISLLPNIDQNNDTLLDALKQNNIFWEHLAEWQILLEHKEFEKKRFDWNITELSSLSWKDENFENYWGERLEKEKGKEKEKEKEKEKGKGKKRGRKPTKQGTNKKISVINDQTDIRKSKRIIAPTYTEYEDE